MGACFQERYRKNRKLEGYLDHVPVWYVRVSKVYAFCVLLFMVLMISLAVGLGVHLWLNGKL